MVAGISLLKIVNEYHPYQMTIASSFIHCHISAEKYGNGL